jgi:hypothetical protein
MLQPGVLAIDMLVKEGGEIAQLSEDDATPDRFVKTLDIVSADPGNAQERLPAGPTWADVGRLFAGSRDVRDRAILMLFAIYGFTVRKLGTLNPFR